MCNSVGPLAAGELPMAVIASPIKGAQDQNALREQNAAGDDGATHATTF